MQVHSSYIPFKDTQAFSPIITSYLSQDEKLKPFYLHSAGSRGIEASILSRQAFKTNRKILVEHLESTYANLSVTESVATNIKALSAENTFTITTAHQPNLFTGPSYFIYKIAHAVSLSRELNFLYPQYHFVPVYYMGSEDADFDELNHFTIEGKTYNWKTQQGGAFGRMLLDKYTDTLLEELNGQLGVLPYGEEIIHILKSIYTNGKSIQQATLELVNTIFGAYGLLVLIPDAAIIKNEFASIITKELTEGFSYTLVQQTIEKLQQHYKVQAAGRPINLFYLKDNLRERIELQDDVYQVLNTEISFTKSAILQELADHPERFSPNVILRGLLQETILPNIVFIGGGGEIAYWLELKDVFENAAVPYPLLLLRNSFLLMKEKQQDIKEKLDLTDSEIFKPADTLIRQWVLQDPEAAKRTKINLQTLRDFYNTLEVQVAQPDHTLKAHVASLREKALGKLEQLEKKLMRAEKRKHEASYRQLLKLKSELFPGGVLQERVENIWGFYALYGSSIIDMLIEAGKGIEPAFCLITISNDQY